MTVCLPACLPASAPRGRHCPLCLYWIAFRKRFALICLLRFLSTRGRYVLTVEHFSLFPSQMHSLCPLLLLAVNDSAAAVKFLAPQMVDGHCEVLTNKPLNVIAFHIPFYWSGFPFRSYRSSCWGAFHSVFTTATKTKPSKTGDWERFARAFMEITY